MTTRNKALTLEYTLDTVELGVQNNMTDIRLTSVCKGQLEMVLTWSIEAVFHKDCVKEICFPLDGLDREQAKREYKRQAYKLLAKLHNAPLKGKDK